jgi:citrate synthase
METATTETADGDTAGARAGGLEGVVAARTALSHVDGEAGRLVVRGHDVESLAERTDFEGVVHLLETGALPDAARSRDTRDALGRARWRASERLMAVAGALAMADGMDALRASLASLAVDGRPHDAGTTLIGATAVFAAAWSRVRRGLEPILPDRSLSHAEDYLRMTCGQVPGEAQARALDAYLVTVSDHGMNASTFAARVIPSTGSDVVSAVVGAVGALKGPLHGGAPGPVLDMLDAIGEPGAAVEWLGRELAQGRRVMGMGHRVYRVRDPRAAVLERAIERLQIAGTRSARLELARAVERAAEVVLRGRHPGRPLRANVEFYTAVLLDAVGIPREAFSTTFAVGRVAGWVAHVEEQRETGRLIRPASEYVGPMSEPPGRP